jgi:type I restriction-modification system DNA methylase subunit
MLSRSPNTTHLISLAPQGMAGFVLANGSMSSNQSGEGDIRRALIEADLVDCMVALPESAKLEEVNLNAIGFR